MCRNLRFLVSFVLVLCLFGNAWGLVWGSKDIGNPGIPGSSSYNAGTGTWTIQGSGHDIWGNGDGFHYVYRPLSGDGSLQLNLVSMDVTSSWAKVGPAVRETLGAGSKHAMTAMTGGNGIQFVWRTNTDQGSYGAGVGGETWPKELRITRSGDWLISEYFEETIPGVLYVWSEIGRTEIPMNTDVTIGMVVCATNNGALNTAVIDSVILTAPPYEKPWDLSPADGSTGMPLTQTLSWMPGDSATSHDVFFGTDPAALALVATKALGDESYNPGPLEICTVYYWQIVEQPLSVASAILSFKTAGPTIASIFDGHLDLGRPGEDPLLPGNVDFCGDVYTVTGGGSDWWHEGEYAHFVHKLIEGDFRIEADVAWQGDPGAGNEWKKAGVAIRNDINRWAGNEKEVNFATAVTRPNVNRGTFLWRLDPEEDMGSTHIVGAQPTRVAIQRCTDTKGDSFVEGFVDRGSGWERIDGKWAFNLNDPVYVGLFVTSHDNSTTETADFTNVQFVEPVCPAEFPRKPGAAVWDPERTAPVAGGWGILEVVDNGPMNSIADAITSLESATGTRRKHDWPGPINICDSDPQTDAKNFGGDGPYGVVYYGDKTDGTVDDLAALARGQVMIPHTDYWSFYINSDNGDELSVDNGALVIGSEDWETDSFRTVYLTAGPHNIQVIHREHTGEADVEVAAARGATTDLSDFRLIGSGEPGEPEVVSIVPGLANSSDPHNNIWIDQSDPGGSLLWNLTDAAADPMTIVNHISATLVNHSDPDNRGGGNLAFGGDCNFPQDVVNGPGSDDNDFAIFAMGEIRIDMPGTYYIGYNSDDGARLTIYGQTWLKIVEDETGTATLDGAIMKTDGITGRSWTVGKINLAPGNHWFDLLMFERDRGAFVELFGGSVPGVYGLLKKGPERMVVKPAVAPALELVHQEPVCLEPIPGDHNNNCKIDFYDIAVACSHWVECNLVPVSDCQ